MRQRRKTRIPTSTNQTAPRSPETPFGSSPFNATAAKNRNHASANQTAPHSPETPFGSGNPARAELCRIPRKRSPRNTGSVCRPFPRRPPRPSFSTSVYPRVYRASPPADSFTCAMRMLRRRAHRNRRTLPQALRQLHSRAPCACFVGALIGTASHFRKPSGSFILVRRARASSPRSPETQHASAQTLRLLHSRAPRACFVGALIGTAAHLRANPPAASFTCAMRMLRRCAHRNRRTLAQTLRRLHSRAPRACFVAVLTGNAAHLRANFPAASFTCAMRVLRRRAHRNCRTLAQIFRRLHSRAPCACFVGALIGTAAHLRASPPAASFSCAVRVLRRHAHRNRRLSPRLPRKPSGGFTKVRSRSP